MGLFGSIFSGYRSQVGDHDVLFHRQDELRHALHGIVSLRPEQREIVFDLITKELDGVGIVGYEWKTKLRPALYRLQQRGEISRDDYRHLLNLFEGRAGQSEK